MREKEEAVLARSLRNKDSLASTGSKFEQSVNFERNERSSRFHTARTASEKRLLNDRAEQHRSRSELGRMRREAHMAHMAEKATLDEEHYEHMRQISQAVDEKNIAVKTQRKEDGRTRDARVRKGFDVKSAQRQVEGEMLVENWKESEVSSQLNSLNALPALT